MKRCSLSTNPVYENYYNIGIFPLKLLWLGNILNGRSVCNWIFYSLMLQLIEIYKIIIKFY